MDTSGLASSLSLAAFLLSFAYLSLAETNASTGTILARPSEPLSRLLLALRFLRLSSLVAAALSAHALLVSQTSPSVALIAIVALDLLALLMIIERAAKLMATRYPGMASSLASPLKVPLSRLLGLLPVGRSSGTEQAAGNGREHNSDSLDPADTPTMVISEEEQASLDDRERLMIRSILRLDESTAREVMVPRVDVVAVEAGTSLADVANRMLECGHSRLPVYSETIDNVTGVIYARDLLPVLTKTEEYPPLEKIIRPAYFIPESKRLDELLRELQEKRVQMAVVVDEYGGVEGLVTLEDLLEEIVGEIEDEFSRSLGPRVVPLANGDIITDARVTLDYLSDLFASSFENEDVDTVGGLVYSSLGKMPQVGDEVVYNGLRIEVVSLLGRRIRKLKLSRTQTHQTQ